MPTTPARSSPAPSTAGLAGPAAPRRRSLRQGLRRLPWPVLAVVSAGGVLGALSRYALLVAWPPRPGAFPLATFVTNVSGCLLIGVLMVLIAEVWTSHRLLRPFLGTGVLGGYTTFSTYTVDVQRLVSAGAARTAVVYLLGTLAAALAATYAGTTLARLAARAHHARQAAHAHRSHPST